LVNAYGDLDITRTQGTGITVGAIAVVVNVSNAEARGLVKAEVNDAVVTASDAVEVKARYDALVRAATFGVSAGLGAVGAMNASTQAGLGQDGDAHVNISGASELKGVRVNVSAEVNSDLFTATTVGGGGGFAGVGAVSRVDDDTTSLISVGAGTNVLATSVNIGASADRSTDGTADAYAYAVASGAGAALYVNALGDARVEFAKSTDAEKTTIVGRSIQIDSYNQTYKEHIISSTPSSSSSFGLALADRNVSSGSASFFGVSILGSVTQLGNNSNKSNSLVDIGDARVSGVGSFVNPSIVNIRALSNHSAADSVEVNAIGGLAGLAVATSEVDIDADTRVKMSGAIVDNQNGNVFVETRANIRNTSDTAAFQTGYLSANLGVDSKSLTDSNTQVDVENSTITGAKVEVNAGKANFTVNSLVSRADANGSLVSAGVSIGVALIENSPRLTSSVNVSGNSQLLSAGNLYVSAESGLKQYSSDGLVVAVAVPPYGYSVSNSGSASESATVNIDPSARLRAGVNYRTVYEVAYAADFLVGPWAGALDGLAAGQSERDMTTAEKARYNLNASQDYKIGFWDTNSLAVDMYNRDIVRVDAANEDTIAGGQAGHHYQFVGNPSNVAMSINLTTTNYDDTSLWRHIGTSVNQVTQDPFVFGSNDAAFIRSALVDQIVVVRPTGIKSPEISVGQVSSLLSSQYEQVRSLIAAQDTNPEMLVRYHAQLDQIARQMTDLGLTPPDRTNPTGGVLQDTLETLFIEMPDIVAAPGSIYINSPGRAPANFNSLTLGANPTMKAHTDVTIDIKSDLFIQMRLGDVIINSSKVARISEATGDYREFYPGNIYVNDVVVGTESTNSDPAQIDILIDVRERAHYQYLTNIQAHFDTLNASISDPALHRSVPNLKPDLYILGSIINDLGAVNLTNSSAAIRVSGQILANQVNIASGGDFTVSTDWYHAGANPRTYDGLSNFVSGVEGGSSEPGTTTQKYLQNTNSNDAAALATLNASRFDTTRSAVIANGIVSIIATYVNVNGLIQSGQLEASVSIASTFNPPNYTTSLISSSKTGIAGITFGSVNGTQLPVRGRWDNTEKAIILDEMDFAGGRIEITGKVFSTGAGRLHVASGYANVSIRNHSNYKLIVNGIDASRERIGVIQITDTQNRPNGGIAHRVTYEQNGNQTDVTVSKADLIVAGDPSSGLTFNVVSEHTVNSLTSSYTPQQDLFYTYTEGKSSIVQIIDTKYVKSFNIFFNFPAGAGSDYSYNEESLSEAPILEGEDVITQTDLIALGGSQPGNWAETEVSARFRNVLDTQIELQSTNLVRNVTTGAYFEYTDTSANLKVLLADLFDSGNNLKSEYSSQFATPSTPPTFTENNRDLGQYLSDYKNRSDTFRQWTTGGGYMKKKTVWRETTTVEGRKRYWDVGLRADYPVEVKFLRNTNEPTITIESKGALHLAGDIRSSNTGNVFINSAVNGFNGGNVTSGEKVTVIGELQAMNLRGDVDLNLVNNVGTSGVVARVIDITTPGDIRVGVGSSTNNDGRVIVRNAVSTSGGNVYISAAQGITLENSNSLIKGDRVELQSSMGSVGNADQAIRIDTNHNNVNGGFSGAAQSDLYVTEISGDLHLVKPTEIQTNFVRTSDAGPISVGTITGETVLSTISGSIYDYNFEDDTALTNARMSAYLAKMGLNDGTRTIVGAQLDNEIRAEYDLTLEYWELMRRPTAESGVYNTGPSNSDLTTLVGFQQQVAARVETGTTQSVAEAEITARFAAVHATNFDRPLTDTILYQQYYAVIHNSGETVTLSAMSTFIAEVERQVHNDLAGRMEVQFGMIHEELARRDVGDSSAVRTYIQTVHNGFSDPTERPELSTANEESFGKLHDVMWNFDHTALVNYIDVVRAGEQSALANADQRPLALMEAQKALMASIADSDFDPLLANIDTDASTAGIQAYDGAAKKAAIEADLTYKFEVLHEANKDRAMESSYVTSLFLEGQARIDAIDAQMAKQSNVNAALSSGVAKELYPLIDLTIVAGGAGPAGENANIIAPVVKLYANGTGSEQGKVGTLTAPVDLDFTLELDSTKPGLTATQQQTILEQQNLRRALQTQDIVDIVYQIYKRTGGGDAIMTAQPDTESLKADANWSAINTKFVERSSGASVNVATGEALVVWGVWPVAGQSEPVYSYRVFERIGATANIVTNTVNWDILPALQWSEIEDSDTKSFANVPTGASLTVAQGDTMIDLWSVLRVSAQPFADVNLRAVDATAGLTLDLRSDGLAGVGHDGATLNVVRAEAGGFLRVVTTGDLHDVSSNATAAVARDYISLIADGDIGTTSQHFGVNVSAGSVLLLQSGGNSYVAQRGGSLIVEKALTGGSFTLTTPSSLQIGEIEVLGTFSLSAGGSITDRSPDDADPFVDIKAASLVLDVTGSLGVAGNNIEIDVTGGVSGTVATNAYLQDFDLFRVDSDLTIGGIANFDVQNTLTTDADATLNAGTLTLNSRAGNIGTSTQSFDVNITGVSGSVTGTAISDIWMSSDTNVPVTLLRAVNIIATNFKAALLNARSDSNANIDTKDAQLLAASIGLSSKALRTKVENISFKTTAGTWLTEQDDLTMSNVRYNGYAAEATGPVVLTSIGDLSLTEMVRVTGQSEVTAQNITVTGGDWGSLGGDTTFRAIDVLTFDGNSGGTTSQGNVLLYAGDQIVFGAGTTTQSDQTLTIGVDLVGQTSEAVDAAGGIVTLNGSWNASDINLITGTDKDTVTLTPERIDGNVHVMLGADEDNFTINELNTRNASHSFLIDGQGAADEYVVNRNQSAANYVLTFQDTGARDDGADFLTINGRGAGVLASADPATQSAPLTSDKDVVLVRKSFIALMNETAPGTFAQGYERINYGSDMNGRVRVNGFAGEDAFYSDDTSTMITLDGGLHNDTFQIGQLFGSARVAPNVAAGDEIETNETTQGFLSVGNSMPMLVYGGLGEDVFNVFSNKALTKLFGEDGNDMFVVRAFVLKSDKTKTAGAGDTELFGGAGDDSILYNLNAPLKIDGGAGVDKIIVLGTEENDSFLLTDQGIYGSGLNISFEGLELAEVDALEGDDTFYVLSTSPKIATTIIGGMGSDTINIGGDVTTDIVSLEVEGTSSFVNHSVLSEDPAFNEIFVSGVNLNLADASRGLVEIRDTGLTLLEGGAEAFYEVRLTSSITTAAYLTASAARSSTQDRQTRTEGSRKAESLLISKTSGGAQASAQVLSFTAADFAAGATTSVWKRVYVQAPDDDAFEGLRTVVLSHALLSDAAAVQNVLVGNIEIAVQDDDKADVLVAGNITQLEVVEGGSAVTVDLVLSREPLAGEIVTVTPSLSKDGDFTYNQVSFTFDVSNWNVPQQLILTAFDDTLDENRERETIKLSVTSNQVGSEFSSAIPVEIDIAVVDNDKGSVIVTETNGGTIVSEGASDTYELILSKAPTHDVTVSVLTDGQTTASSTDLRWNADDKTITFNAANWNTKAVVELTFATIVQQGQPTINPGLQPQVVSAIRGPLYVYGGTGPGANRTVNQGVSLPTETDVALPFIANPVDETLNTDRLFFYNAGSSAVQSGVLTETNISGFDMASTPLVLNVGTPAAPQLSTFDAGITYEGLEIVELMLGQNDDTLDIHSTASGAITVVHGGGGSDTLRVTGAAGTADAGGEDRALILLGDTTQDGQRYDFRSTNTPNGNARVFAANKHGNDVIDATGAKQGVIIYGGRGNDSITGSVGDDNLLGGSGDDTIHALGGRDHIYGDNGLRIDLSVRNSLQPQLVTIVRSQVLGAEYYDTQTGDPLAAAGNDVITATGDNIILSDFGVIQQLAGTNRAFNTGAVVQVRSDRVDEGDNDNITTGLGKDWIIAGIGRDEVRASGGNNAIFGDHGVLDIFAATYPLKADTALTLPNLGGDDTIVSGDGDDWVLGGGGSDQITDGTGKATIIGDLGTITANAMHHLVSVATKDTGIGGADAITKTDGDAIVLAGAGDDTVTTGAGNSVLLGDFGSVVTDGAGIIRSITSADTSLGGDDTISAGAGGASVFGGFGSDNITTGDGDDAILGDVGTLTFVDGIRSKLVGTIETPSYGAGDTILTNGGEDWVIGGAAADTITNISGASAALGDAGVITADAAGRYINVVSTQPDDGGNDIITGGRDSDFIFGGAGSDLLDGGRSNDMIAADGGLMSRDTDKLGRERHTFETIDFFSGDADTLIGGHGQDVMFGGHGGDKFQLNLADDIVAGEYARVRIVDFASGRNLVTSFLSMAPRGTDLLVQTMLGLENQTRVPVRAKTLPAMDVVDNGLKVTELSLRPDDRADLFLVTDGALLGANVQIGTKVQIDADPGSIPGLAGFSYLATPNLLSDELPSLLEDKTLPETDAVPAPEATTLFNLQQNEQGDPEAVEVAALEQAAVSEKSGAWKFLGWALSKYDA